jgi:ankyrin repeat protein
VGDFEKLIEAAQQGNVADVTAIVHGHAELINRRDQRGATALHHAAWGGHCGVVQALVDHGAEINTRDREFGATPAGWAIEYLRELGGFLAIELDDLAYAIRRGDVEWVARFLKRFPTLREASDPQGIPFKLLAEQSGNPEIAKMFGAAVAT